MSDTLSVTLDSVVEHHPDSVAAVCRPWGVVDSCFSPSVLGGVRTTGLSASVTATAAGGWRDGCAVEPRPATAGNDVAVLALIALLTVVALCKFGSLRRMLSGAVDELWSLRRRSNAFDEHSTADTLLMTFLIVIFVVSGGLVLGAGAQMLAPTTPAAPAGIMMGIVAAYYLLRLGAYAVTGYIFAPGLPSRQWLSGYNASVAVSGAAMVVPATAMTFYPEVTLPAFILAIAMYFCALSVFIAKGFRIFYDKPFSLIYFILYLCSLEIIPLVYVVFCAVEAAEIAAR